MVIDTDKIRNQVQRIDRVYKNMKRFITMYPNSYTLYKAKDHRNDELYLSDYTNFSLYLNTASFSSEYKINEFIKQDISVIYMVGGSTFYTNENYDEEDILDISVLTEEYLFQRSLDTELHVLEGLYFMAVCKEMNMATFNTTLSCLEILEGLVDGYYRESDGQIRKTKEGSIVRIDMRSERCY